MGRSSALVCQSWVEGVAEADADEVEAEGADVDHETGDEDVLPLLAVEALGLVEHVAPRGSWHLDAETEETQGRLGQDDEGDRQRRLYQQNRRYVGEEVAKNDRSRRDADDAR